MGCGGALGSLGYEGFFYLLGPRGMKDVLLMMERTMFQRTNSILRLFPI